jgi:hypothetical protein
MKTWTEPVSFKNPAAKRLQVTFVQFFRPGQTPEQGDAYFLWQRALERGWTTRTMVSDHNAQNSHPKELVALLEDAPKDRNQPNPEGRIKGTKPLAPPSAAATPPLAARPVAVTGAVFRPETFWDDTRNICARSGFDQCCV